MGPPLFYGSLKPELAQGKFFSFFVILCATEIYRSQAPDIKVIFRRGHFKTSIWTASGLFGLSVFVAKSRHIANVLLLLLADGTKILAFVNKAGFETPSSKISPARAAVLRFGPPVAGLPQH